MFEPGEQMQYSNPGIALMPKSYHEAYRQFLFEPLTEAVTGKPSEAAPTPSRASDTNTKGV